MRTRPLFLLVPVLLVAVTAFAPASQAKSRKDIRLRQFKTCPSLIAYGNRHAPQIRQAPAGPPIAAQPAPEMAPMSGGGKDTAGSAPAPTAAPVAGQDFSTTNTQVAGVDEPDIVKTDGKTVFAVNQNMLRAIDVSGDTPKLAGTLALSDSYDQQILLDGDRILASWTEVPIAPTPIPAGAAQAPSIAPMPGYYAQPRTVLAEISVADPAHMKILRTMTVDGTLVASRLTGSSARVVLST